MTKVLKFLAVAACTLGGSALAQNPVITSYDITDAARTGFGGWGHNYGGSIVDTGSFSANGFAFTRADYSGGSGTLNDGSEGSSPGDTQLFANNANARPRITLHLDGSYAIASITLYSFDSGNTIPGTLVACDVTIGGQTQSFNTTEPTLHDEFIDLSNSPLGNIPTNTVILDNFVWGGNNGLNEMFCIGEIGLVGGSAGFSLNVTGTCPGTVTVAWRNATPSRQLAIVFGNNQGNTTIPTGPCAGTQLGVQGSVRLVNTIGSGSGSGSVNGNAGTSACGHFLQLVESGSCDTSNVARIP